MNRHMQEKWSWIEGTHADCVLDGVGDGCGYRDHGPMPLKLLLRFHLR